MSNKNYHVYTVCAGKVTHGAKVEKFTLKGAGVDIPAVLVGEQGRGRHLGVLPVQLLPDQQEEWEKNGSVEIYAAQAGQTKSGRPKLFATEVANSNEKIIAVLRTPIGFRGSNSHTGDRVAEMWKLMRCFRGDAERLGIPIKEEYTADEVRRYSPLLFPDREGEYRWDAGFDRRLEFAPFPGEVLTEGIIAQGEAGRMGAGDQMVAVIPKNQVFRTGYSGRLYGSPPAHYYMWTGEKVLSATWEERELAELF